MVRFAGFGKSQPVTTSGTGALEARYAIGTRLNLPLLEKRPRR